MNHLRSCFTSRVKIVWWNRCKCCKFILDFDLEFSPINVANLPVCTFFGWATIFALFHVEVLPYSPRLACGLARGFLLGPNLSLW